jgi:hypothetical protein
MFDYQEGMLRSAGVDRSRLLESLNHGLDVFRIEPGESQTLGRMVGFLDKRRLRVVLAFEPEPPAPADWRLLSLERSGFLPAPLASLSATWSANSPQGTDIVAGNAEATVREFLEVQTEYQSWIDSWRPPEVSVPFLIVHLASGLPRTSRLVAIIGSLLRSDTDVFVPIQPPARPADPRGRNTLRLALPSHRVILEFHLRQLQGSGPNEWVLVQLTECAADTPFVAQLHAVWRLFSLGARREFASTPCDPDWLDQLSACEASYRKWQETGWVARQLSGGFFRLRLSGKSQQDLAAEGLTSAQLCEALNHEFNLYEVTGRESDVIVGTTAGGKLRVRVALYRPSIGASDWKLMDLRLTESALPSFARLAASWEAGAHGQPARAGDAAASLKELTLLQERRRDRSEQIEAGIRKLSGDTPELAERITSWRRVCELERDLFQVGITHLERAGDDYRLVPEEQQEVLEWIEELESINPEGVDWVRYPLDLRLGDERASLVIQSLATSQDEEENLILTLACAHPMGRALMNRLCDGAELARQEPVRLFLPDTQLRLIDNALTLLDPNRQTGTQRRGVVGEELAPDDLSLHTLQKVLAEPSNLEPLTQAWPPLPTAPLAELSPNQEMAVRVAVFGPDVTLIQGPPGTGKTTVILEILRQLFHLHGRSPAFKVLLVAPTHVAVDNVLERLVAPRRGSNLVMEIGVAPYRLGSTRRIAEHLRGFTPDCINTDYRQRLEREVAQATIQAHAELKLDRSMLDIMAEGARRDQAGWEDALRTGEISEQGWSPTWPATLDEEWQARVATPEGRLRAWRHWRARGSHPEGRAILLQRWLDFLRANPRFFSELLVANANLVCATTIGCATQRELRSAVYDYVIVDEAGKEEARRLLVPMIRGERWILVGDHQQLPPYADDELKACLIREGLDPQTITRSLFEELQEPFERRGCYVFLDRQGRMHPDISAFVSQRFYGGRLGDFAHVANHSISRPSFLPDEPRLLVLDTRRLSDRHETRQGTGYINLLEQELVLRLLRSFAGLSEWQGGLSDGSRAAVPTIGVIAPYRLQVQDIERRARRDPVLRVLLREGLLHVGTVDSFQGQEMDVILFTCTRSNGQGRLGFVDNRQRLNVALSRARCRLIAIVDGCNVEQACLRHDVEGAEADTRDHLHALIEFARSRGGAIEMPSGWKLHWRG